MSDRLSRRRTVALANQKGGVGKTTTAINLATAMAAIGKQVLLVDLDPQGNASTGLGIDAENRSPSTYDLLLGDADLPSVLRKTQIPGLQIAPSEQDLSGADMELSSLENRTHRLQTALRSLDLKSDEAAFDYVFIDCPPSLNLLTVNALAASDSVLVPLQSEFFALEGLSQLMKTIERVREGINPRLEIQGVVLTMTDRRNNLSMQVEEDARGALGSLVYQTVVPRNVRLSEAPSHGLPAIVYDQQCAGSVAYQALAGEFLQREASSLREQV
ncbi:MAG: AAA family ATPase [Pseudomonadota bacterium]